MEAMTAGLDIPFAPVDLEDAIPAPAKKALAEAAEGYLRALSHGRDGLCTRHKGKWLCTRQNRHEPPCICASVSVRVCDMWNDEAVAKVSAE